jgi:hypothetical protein
LSSGSSSSSFITETVTPFPALPSSSPSVSSETLSPLGPQQQPSSLAPNNPMDPGEGTLDHRHTITAARGHQELPVTEIFVVG